MSKNYEAVLVHSMGTEDDKEEPHLRGMTLVIASVYWAYLAHAENPQFLPHLVFTGKHYWGETERLPIGLVNARAAIRELKAAKVDSEVTFLPDWKDDDGQLKPIVDSSSEIQGFIQFAQQHKFARVASLSSQTHLTTIDQLYKRHTTGTQIQGTTLAAEDILLKIPGDIGHQAYEQKVTEVLTSQDEKEFRRRELIKRIAYLFPTGERILREQAEKGRTVSHRFPKAFTILTGQL